MKDLEGRVAVVAGATRGAGRSIATMLGEAGYSGYGRSVGPLMRQAGGRSVLGMTGLTAVISEEEIDRMILVFYPSPENFLSMVESPEFLAVMYKRSDSVELGLNLPFSDHR